MQLKKIIVFDLILTLLFSFSLFAYPIIQGQEPKGSSSRLVDFTPVMMDSPYSIKYPENWYVREEYFGKGNARVYFSREPIVKQEDVYQVGIGVTALPDYFAGNTDPWEDQMDHFLKALEKSGYKASSKEVIKISGRKAMKYLLEGHDKKAIALNLKIGNHLFFFEFRTPQSEFNDYESTFNEIFNSLKWENVHATDKNNPKYDPVMNAFLSNEKQTVVVNGKRREGVKMSDVVKDFMKNNK